MKISISNIAWNKDEEKKVEELFEKYEIKGLEVAPTKIWDDPIHESEESILKVKNYWQKKGISIIAMQSLIFGHPELTLFDSKDSRQSLVDYLSKIIKLAGLLGIKALVFGSPKNRKYTDITETEAYKIAGETFFKLGDIAKENNLYFCIEPNPIEYDTNFINTSKQALELTNLINHPNIKIHLDSGAITSNKENIVQTIKNVSDQLIHFHISQPQLKPINVEETNHALIASTLNKINYPNWVSIEMRNKENNIATIDQTLKLVTDIYG